MRSVHKLTGRLPPIGIKSGLSANDPIADIAPEAQIRQMVSRYNIFLFANLLSLTACSAEPASPAAQVRANESKSAEPITTVSLVAPQWRKDPACFDAGAQTLDEATGFFDVRRVKWKGPRALKGYYFTNFEGASFVKAQRIELPNSLGDGRYQSDLYSDAPNLPGSVENRIYWIEFIGREALCNSQSPDDATFDVPFSRNLVRAEKIIRQERVR